MRGNIFPVTFLFLSCPLQKGLGYKLYPHENNQVQKTLPKGSPKQNTHGCRARQREGQESTYKNVLKIRVKKIVLRFNTPISSLFYTLTPQKRGHLGGTRRQAGAALLLARLALKALRAGLLLPHVLFSFPFGKSTILSSHPRAGWFGLFLWNDQ